MRFTGHPFFMPIFNLILKYFLTLIITIKPVFGIDPYLWIYSCLNFDNINENTLHARHREFNLTIATTILVFTITNAKLPSRGPKNLLIIFLKFFGHNFGTKLQSQKQFTTN